MTWTWRYEDADGNQLADPPASESFGTKGDAESWLGDSWRGLLDGGVQTVVLLEDDRVEYSMPLTPADA